MEGDLLVFGFHQMEDDMRAQANFSFAVTEPLVAVLSRTLHHIFFLVDTAVAILRVAIRLAFYHSRDHVKINIERTCKRVQGVYRNRRSVHSNRYHHLRINHH
jgi:hypothetical protein